MNQTTQIEKTRANKYCKKLAPKLLGVPLPLTRLDKKSATIRRLLKRPFFKKTTILTLKPLVFPYYTPHVLPSIKTLAFDKLDSSVLFRRLTPAQKAHSQLLAKCKHINTLIIPSEFIFSSLRFIRKFRELKHLDLGLPDTQIPQAFDMFKHLVQLKHLKLLISKGSGSIQNHQLHKISKFFQSLKNMAKLKLHIGYSFISENQDILKELLENLGNSNIKEMDIEIHLKAPLDLLKNPSEGIQRFFGKLDLLGVYKAQSSGRKESPQTFLKSLKLAFTGPSGDQEIDLKDCLGFCTSLKELWIHCLSQSIFISEGAVISKELKIFRIRSFISSQKAKIETTINSLAGSKLQVFEMILEDLDHILAKKIAEVNQASNPQEMKSFSLQINIPRGYWATGKHKEPIKMLSSNSINQLVQSLVPFKNLESLELHIGPQDQKFIKHIEYLLDFLPQLGVLDLDLRSLDPEVNNFQHKVPFYFAIEKLPGLGLLRVKLPPSIWIENPEEFFAKLACLKNIRHLELDSYHLAHIPQESIPKIVSVFNQMKTVDTLKIVHVPDSELQRELSLLMNNP